MGEGKRGDSIVDITEGSDSLQPKQAPQQKESAFHLPHFSWLPHPSFSLLRAFSLISFVVVLCVALFLGFVLNHQIKESKLEETKNFLSQFVQHQVQTHLDKELFSFPNQSMVDEKFDTFFSEIHTDNILRIKVWGKNAQIIYSDTKDIVGQSFPDNDDYGEAMGGEVIAEIIAPLGREHVSEAGYSQLMEVYVPAQFADGSIEGVIEVYYKMDALNSTTARMQKTVWVILALGFFLLYISLFFFVKKTSDTLQRQTAQLQSSAKQLGDYSKNLEKKVEERTVELREKVAEMEKFNKLAIGRELKMVELKKRIKELEESKSNPAGGGQ
jgi:hypothetical protein